MIHQVLQYQVVPTTTHFRCTAISGGANNNSLQVTKTISHPKTISNYK